MIHPIRSPSPRRVLALLLVAVTQFTIVARAEHAVDEPLPGPESPYTKWLGNRLAHWSAPALRPESADQGIQLGCIETPQKPKYVGVEQRMDIAAPLSAVVAVLDDFPHYKELFPDLVDVRVVPGSQDGNRFVVYWEQHVPIIPNVKFEMGYIIDKSNPGRAIYRYQLKSGSNFDFSDGAVVVEAIDASHTRYTEYDFIDAHWGPIGKTRVWNESIAGTFRSDMAIKLKAENHDWSYTRARDEAARLAERYSPERCVGNKQQLQLSAR